MQYIIKQGEDKYLTLTIRDKYTSNLIDLSLMDEVIVKITYRRGSLISYSSEVKVGYKELTIDTSNITFKLNREDTKNFPIGTLNITVLTVEPDTNSVGETISTEYSFDNYILVQDGYARKDVIN